MGSLVEERPHAAYLADVLKALAHPTRLRIIAALCEGEESVNGLAGRLGAPQAIVSQQLRILRMSGLVASERDNGFSVYHLAQPRLRQLVSCLDGCQRESTGASGARIVRTASVRAAGGGAGNGRTGSHA